MKKNCFITFLLISLLFVVSAVQAEDINISQTYNGASQKLIDAATYPHYYCLENATGTQTVTDDDLCKKIAIKDAGSKQYYYAVGSTCDADSNCTADFQDTVTITITPAILTITPNSKSKAEGQIDPDLDYTYTGTFNGETPAFTGALDREAGETVGTYEITQGTLASADDDSTSFKSANYTLSVTEDVLLEIVENTNKPTVNTGLVYTGSAQDLLTNGSGSGTWYYLPAGSTATESSEIPQGTDADDYDINCWFVASSGSAADNYWSKDNPLVLTASIDKADIAAADVTAPAAVSGLTYNGSEQTLISDGSCAYGTMLYKTDDMSDYSADLPTATDAGSYIISYSVQGDSNHNDYSASDTVSVTINPKALDDSMITFNPIRFDNDGSSHTAVFTVEDPDCGTLTENTDWETDASSELSASDTGVYTVTVNGLGNYTGTASAEWVVDTTRITANTYTIETDEPLTFILNTDLQNPTITWTISDETIAEFVQSSVQSDGEAHNGTDIADENTYNGTILVCDENGICTEQEAEYDEISENAVDEEVYYTEDGLFIAEDNVSEEESLLFTNEAKDTGEQVFYAEDYAEEEAGYEDAAFDSYDAQGSTSVTGNSVTVKGLQAGTITLTANVNNLFDVAKDIVFTTATQTPSTAPNEITFYLLNDPFRR